MSTEEPSEANSGGSFASAGSSSLPTAMERVFPCSPAIIGRDVEKCQPPESVYAEFFKRGYYPAHHRMICDLYDKFFPKGTKRIFTEGGLFTWAELPGGINTTELLIESTTNPEVKVI